MFIDEVKIKVIAGKGGDGCSSFRREKYVEMGGPDGGNGGKGGDIIFVADAGLKTLIDLRYKKTIKVEGDNEDDEDDEEDENSFDPCHAGFKLLLEYFMMTPEEQVKRHSDYAQLIASLISGHMN